MCTEIFLTSTDNQCQSWRSEKLKQQSQLVIDRRSETNICIYQTPLPWVGWNTRSILKQCSAGLNSESSIFSHMIWKRNFSHMIWKRNLRNWRSKDELKQSKTHHCLNQLEYFVEFWMAVIHTLEKTAHYYWGSLHSLMAKVQYCNRSKQFWTPFMILHSLLD